MESEKWLEIKYLLHDNLSSSISEYEFEQRVLEALRVLGWKRFTGDVEVRPSFQIGATNRITPDFVIKDSNSNNLFVVEIKQPDLQISERHQHQLFSYMRQLKLKFGLLIGQKIQVFYDGELNHFEYPILIENLSFSEDETNGKRFCSLFSKESYSENAMNTLVHDALNRRNIRSQQKKIKEILLEDEYREHILNLIREDFSTDFDTEAINEALDEVNLSIAIKSEPKVFQKPTANSNPNYRNYGNKLEITLNPPDELTFKHQLLRTKKAEIVTIYQDGRKESKIWKASYFKESSGVIRNLRSRPEFRQGNWQKAEIARVEVSIIQ